MSKFSTLPLSKEMVDNLNNIGYSQMTPVQEETLLLILEGKDVIAQAKTGSGKTAAFSCSHALLGSFHLSLCCSCCIHL